MKLFFLTIVFALFQNICIAQNVTNLATSRTWMDRNLGASEVATSSSDAASYGSLYQWGRLSDGHEVTSSNTTTMVSSSSNPGHQDFIVGFDDWISPSNNNLWQGINGINNPCPNGFRIPTIAEWEEERMSWSTNDAAGAFNSPLKLPIAGARSRMSGMIGNVGTFVGYRSSNLNGANAQVMGISLTDAFIGNRARADGNSVRCIQDQSLNVTKPRDLESLNVYPVPATDQIVLSMNDALINETFIIQNVLGKIIFEERLDASEKTINISNLPSGIYFIKVSGLATIKFIKQ
tara:strand:- start:8746 stop:9621 length:876 start_codon:yes stop_codon:yes gene_type:complete